jgi:pre-mRNA-splicing factor SYF2
MQQVDEQQSLGMTDLQKKLFAIRMKINQAKKTNKSEVEEEYRRLSHTKHARNKEDVDNDGNEEYDGNKVKSVGKKWVECSELEQTAADAERLKEKAVQKSENAATFGWQAFTVEASYKAYEKRLKKLPSGTAKSVTETQALDYGNAQKAKVSAAALDRVSKDVVDREENRAKFSKRRISVEGADVDYINDKNAGFNKKIKRAFDKYTVEIRQNLERGTAI